jgi:hypothetical protein
MHNLAEKLLRKGLTSAARKHEALLSKGEDIADIAPNKAP